MFYRCVRIKPLDVPDLDLRPGNRLQREIRPRAGPSAGQRSFAFKPRILDHLRRLHRIAVNLQDGRWRRRLRLLRLADSDTGNYGKQQANGRTLVRHMRHLSKQRRCLQSRKINRESQPVWALRYHRVAAGTLLSTKATASSIISCTRSGEEAST